MPNDIPIPPGEARITRIEHGGATYWLKRPEKLGLRYRLQKGDPVAAFERERRALHALAGRGLPVPEIVAEGPDYFVMTDGGPTLASLLSDASLPEHEKLAACGAVGAALAALHGAGIAHGRPAPRDACLGDGRVTFIDLERCDPVRNTRRGCTLDVLLFFFGFIARERGATARVNAAREGYLAGDDTGLWADAVARARRLRWLGVIAAPVAALLGNNREFNAVGQTLRFFLN